MSISTYHKKYIAQSDEEISNKADEKRNELLAIFKKNQLKTNTQPVRIAVLGCGDKRLIKHHREIFSTILEKPVDIITFDLTIDHLLGENNVFQHDCTMPLPNGPFDITYGHVVLRFIETQKQWDLIKNSYEALNNGGLAIHVLDREDYETKTAQLDNGLFSVPLDEWGGKLSELDIPFTTIELKYGLALVICR